MNKLNYIFIILSFMIVESIFGQSKVAITIDDVPNTSKFERDHFNSFLLNKLDSLNIPISIFINEGLIYKTKHISKNFDLLNQWIKREYISSGNHTFNHSRYSEVGLDSFAIEIDKGEAIIKELSKIYQKQLTYFRFPYNDLGNDSIQQRNIENLLNQKGYIIAPFTVESSDWIFNYLYEHYLKNNQKEKAKRIANSYIELSMDYFAFFDSVAIEQYGRRIKQIYLCHDNSINADYLEILIDKLIKKGYSFISLDKAMKDDVYNQPNHYYKKWGVSWVYRWMSDSKKQMHLMRFEPELMDAYKEYQQIKSINDSVFLNSQ